MTKVLSNVVLVLLNVTIESLNVRKKKEPPNVTKEQLHMMLELHNMKMEPSNARKKKPPNVTKVLSTVMLQLHNVKIEPSNVTKR